MDLFEDLEFVLNGDAKAELPRSRELTGWETVVFVLDDEESD
jgi:predicted protein tyrosine phosphatase